LTGIIKKCPPLLHIIYQQTDKERCGGVLLLKIYGIFSKISSEKLQVPPSQNPPALPNLYLLPGIVQNKNSFVHEQACKAQAYQWGIENGFYSVLSAAFRYD
jgi:hypothetical protein